MKEFSASWKSSKKPKKQRKYRVGAPLHTKQKFVHTHLSKNLREKYRKRNVSLRKGDKIRIMVGKFKKHEGKVARIDLARTRIFIEGVETTKKDGTKRQVPLDPSNLMIVELNMDDKLRQKSLEAKNG